MTPQQAIDEATRIVKQAQDNHVYQVVMPRQVVQVLLGVVLNQPLDPPCPPG